MACEPTKITISIAGVPPIVFSSGRNEYFCLRSRENRRRVDKRTPYGSIAVAAPAHQPTFRWALDPVITSDVLMQFERFYVSAFQTDPAIALTLQDEHEYLPTFEGGIHGRSLVPASTITLGGVSAGYYSFNALMDLKNDNYARRVGFDAWAIEGLTFVERN
jgi:hypothetical protein